MNISEDEWIEFRGEFREFRGEVRATQKNLSEHLNSVSNKSDGIREDLATHVKDQEAHGLGGERRASRDLVAWGAFMVAVLGMLYEIWMHRK